MKRERRGFIAGILVSIIIFACIGTAGAVVGKMQATLDYNNIKISLNGQYITPKDANGNTVEPFSINGTTYLPVRAVGDALGLSVDWDGKNTTVILEGENDTLTSVQLMGYYKILEQSFDNLTDIVDLFSYGKSSYMMNQIVEGGKTAGEAFKNGLIDDLNLLDGHYESCMPYLSDSDIYLREEYLRLFELTIGYINSSLNGDEPQVPSDTKLDCMMGSVKAATAFWETYQSSFS